MKSIPCWLGDLTLPVQGFDLIPDEHEAVLGGLVNGRELTNLPDLEPKLQEASHEPQDGSGTDPQVKITQVASQPHQESYHEILEKVMNVGHFLAPSC